MKMPAIEDQVLLRVLVGGHIGGTGDGVRASAHNNLLIYPEVCFDSADFPS
jgi:hypothetical protein